MASIVWDFFTVSEEDISRAICTKCSANIPRGGNKASSFNTSNLISHLKRQHRYDGVLKAYEDASAAKEAPPKLAAKKCPGLVPIAAAFEKCKRFSRDDPRAKAICDFIIEMMALDDQPFTIVEDTGFCRLVNHLEPRFVLPSRRYFSDVCLPAKYDVIATLLQTLIDGNKDISFTTDLWTCDVSPISLLGLTAQWLDKDFKLYRAVLHAQELPGSHTATLICEAFEDMLKRWNITKEMVHVVLRDNGRNVVKAMDDCGLASLGCMAHTLQLAVNEAVLSQRAVSDCIAIGRKIVGHFKHSQVASTALEKLQERLQIPKTRLQQDVATRWNSTFYMLKSLVAQKQAIAAYAVEYKLPATLSAHQWTLVENMLTLLDPCEQLTRNISKATATAADVIPSVQALTRLLKQTVPTDHGVKTSKDTLMNAIQTRFGHIEAEPLYYLGTLLDPRYKNRYFTLASKRQATEMLREQLHSIEDDRVAHGSPHPDDPPAKRSRADGNNNSLMGMFDEILEENNEATAHQENTRVDADVSIVFI